ncbi:small conductance mechanosensitive ion channel (MscS) family protein [Streptococcus pneumoniae SP19-BS75]|nr:small conductance mechanosensitive ion channel (MscS) family protein [Streptococcus pneumoniae SP19-BS75]
MQKFIQAYIEKLDVTTIIENILTKVISLLLLLIVFYIAKKNASYHGAENCQTFSKNVSS